MPISAQQEHRPHRAYSTVHPLSSPTRPLLRRRGQGALHGSDVLAYRPSAGEGMRIRRPTRRSPILMSTRPYTIPRHIHCPCIPGLTLLSKCHLRCRSRSVPTPTRQTLCHQVPGGRHQHLPPPLRYPQGRGRPRRSAGNSRSACSYHRRLQARPRLPLVRRARAGPARVGLLSCHRPQGDRLLVALLR